MSVTEASRAHVRLESGSDCLTGPVSSPRSVLNASPSTVLLLADLVVVSALALALVGKWWLAVAYTAASLAVLSGQQLHRVRLCMRVADQVPQLLIAAAAPAALLVVSTPGVALGLAAATGGGLIVGRWGYYRVLGMLYRRGLRTEPTLLVGSSEETAELAEVLRQRPEYGMRPQRTAAAQWLPEIVYQRGINRVILCSESAELVTAVRALRSSRTEIWVLPRLAELGIAVPSGNIDELWGTPLIPLRNTSSLGKRAVKRLVDVVLSLLLLVALTPVLLGIGLAVGVNNRGKVLYRQVRVTLTGRHSRVVKFRTVTRSCDQLWTVPPGHCTLLGKWLRQTHLDELPQLLNVVRGDMSLVGPRPERPQYAIRFAQEIPHYSDRHRMRGGMTGWAQVNGLHGDTSIPDRARFDNQYIEYWSLWWDIVIILRTIGVVARAMCSSTSGKHQPAASFGEAQRRAEHIPTGEQ